MAEVIHKQGQGRTFFVLVENGNKIGTLAYTRPDSTVMVIQHTVTDDGFEDKFFKGMLLDAAADFARQNNLRINTMCSYAKSAMRETDRYSDVLLR